ncbi:MAG: OpgC domain-containing protein [Celeribacter sp.]|jgi:hypothetical protein
MGEPNPFPTGRRSVTLPAVGTTADRAAPLAASPTAAQSGDQQVAPAASLAVQSSAAPRDARLDFFRGLALIMIYLNHVPGTLFEDYTNRNFGFSDAAEGFVIMSGIAAGLAYGRLMSGVMPLWRAVLRVWHRAWTLYMVHVVTTMMAIGLSAYAADRFGVIEMVRINNLRILFEDPLGVLVGIPTLGHQLGYFNILPMYAVLIFCAPLLIALGRRSAPGLMAASVLLWVLAGQFRLNLPNHPNPGGWFFNPVAWQLVFVTGLLTGMALKEGRRFVAYRAWLFWICVALLVGSLAWMKIDVVRDGGRAGLAWLATHGAPFYLTSFDKTYLAAPRLLHALALFYVISCLPVMLRIARAQAAAPIALLGRFGLPVFATGSVLSIMGQAIKKSELPQGVGLDMAVIGGGLALQFAIAGAFWWVARNRPAPARVST